MTAPEIEKLKALAERDECCNHNCNQSDTCPRRLAMIEANKARRFDRRTGPSILWRLFGWLLRDKRRGDRRRH